MMLNRNLMRFFAIIFTLAFVSPAFADGTLNVTKGSLSAPSYINTKTATPMVNMTVNATTGDVNLTGILVNITGSAASSNVSYALVYNDSDNDGVIDIITDLLLGSAAVNTTTNTSDITFNSNFTIAADTEYFLIVALNVSSNATRFVTTGLNISSNVSITTYTSDDIIVTGNYIESGLSQIQDVHATASISPSFVDTNVTNQSFVYILNVTGRDKITETIITIPVGYSVINVTNVTIGGAECLYTGSPTCVVGYSVYYIDVNRSAGIGNDIVKIYFTINTNSSDITALKFNSTITGSNLTNAETDVVGTNTTVTTRVLINITAVNAIKSAAYLNGTDYWEFSFTLNFTLNISGILQFKMTNWTDDTGHSIRLVNSTGNGYLATLRNETNFATTGKINIANDYNISSGIPFTVNTASNPYTVTLRMVIPSTVSVVSSSWWATYSMLFRSNT